MRRRHFLGTLAGAAGLSASEDFQAPPVTNPRATSGDRIEPRWESAITVTVGPQKADLMGADQRVIQAAVDYVARLGGGTVRILPGTYRMRNAVYLQSNVRILGSGLDSVLLKEPSVKTKLAQNSDWYDREITLEDAHGFEVGDGVVLRTRNPDNGGLNVFKRTLIARSGNRFKLDKMLTENYWTKQEPTAATLFALFDGLNISDVTIENITLDGNRANNENLNGNYVGCIFLRESNAVRMRGVTTRNFNGDGISWQVCHDVRVEDGHSHDNAGLGVHPGSGSQRTVVVNNRLERNDIGFFFCWGVKWGLCERNTILDSKRFGISVGHNDTDNVIRGNQVLRSGQVGVLFRQEHGAAFSPNRNRLEDNTIVDSGGEKGIGVKVEGQTREVEIARNRIRETRGPAARVGIRIEPGTADIRLSENTIEGFAQAGGAMTKPGERLVSLDAYRGCIMLILVSHGFGLAVLAHHPGWEWVARQVDHAAWEGCTFWDLIQPAFTFMVGMAMPFALARRMAQGAGTWNLFRHVAWRAFLLIVLSNVLSNWGSSRPRPVLQLINVLCQIAFGYFLCFLITRLPFAGQVAAAFAMLAGYWALLAVFPGADGPFSKADNIGAVLDLKLLGYKYSGYYTTINFIGNAVTILFGCWAGMLVRTDKSHAAKLKVLAGCAAACFALGLALAPVNPMVKRLWTASFTFYSTGWVLLMLLVFYWLVEVKGFRRWTFLFVVFGMNSIFIYCFWQVLRGWLDRGLRIFTGNFWYLGDLGAIPQNLLVLAVMWYMCYWLYQRRIFFKL